MAVPDGALNVKRLVDDHYADLYRYAYRLSGSADDASDLVQDAFLKAQAQLRQLRDPSRAKSWLFSILRNSYLHRIRMNKTHREVAMDDLDIVAASAETSPPEVEPERLQKLLNELPEGFRTPLILFYFKSFSYRDIAEQMDLPIGTIMSRLARAKAHLRSRLT